MSQIHVYRKPNSSVKVKEFTVIVDKKRGVPIKEKQTKKIDVKDNEEHSLQVQVRGLRSDVLRFTPKKNKSLHFECGSELHEVETISKIVGITVLFIIIETAISMSLKITQVPQFIAYMIVMILIYLLLIKVLAFDKPLVYLKEA